MYRSLLNSRERAGAVAAVAAVHLAILLALLAAGRSGAADSDDQPPPIEIFDITQPADPPPVVEPVEQEPAPEEEGAASPPNVISRATPVVAPEPQVIVPPVVEVVASPTPAQGSDPTQGAAPDPGPGTGAGGTGTGTGSGGAGSGPGGGGGPGGGRGPSVVRDTTLRGRDYPRAVIRAWPSRAPVFVAVRVQLDGRATDCKVNRSSGDQIVDRWTCHLVEQKVRFRPALDDNGEPYVAWYGYVQSPVNF